MSNKCYDEKYKTKQPTEQKGSIFRVMKCYPQSVTVTISVISAALLDLIYLAGGWFLQLGLTYLRGD